MSTIPFSFPLSRQKYESFETLEDLRAVLKKEADAFSIWKDTFRVYDKHEKKYVYAKCKHCRAVLRYKWSQEQEAYRLRVFTNQHIHVYEQQENEQLAKFINDLPLGVDLTTARNIAMKQLNISASKFYHFFSKIKRSKASLGDLIKEFERRDYDICTDPFPIETNNLPDIIVIISPQMKKLFQLYGQVVSYDLTYNLIRERTNNNHQYAVGVFTGVNCYNRIIPFGITITCLETTDAFARIFETFIQVNGQPRSFITDEQQGMIGALMRLKEIGIYSGSHLFDSFHVIRNFGKVSARKDLLGQLSDIIREECPVKFDIKIDDLKKELKRENELKAYQLFTKKIDQVCFSQLKEGSFVIFNASNSINEKMNDLIKCRIRSQKPYTQVIRILADFAQTLVQSSQGVIELYDFRVENLFQDSNLKIMRYLLAKRPMEEFLRQYVASLAIKGVIIKGKQYIFEQKYNKFKCEDKKGEYQCNCGYTGKTGIGCKHMLYICKQKMQDYLETIHPRWKFDKKPQIIINRRGGTRKTRRRG